jgi:hypothetical protein
MSEHRKQLVAAMTRSRLHQPDLIAQISDVAAPAERADLVRNYFGGYAKSR